MERWKVRFLNLPCDEQLFFAQKVAFEESLHKDYLEWLQGQVEDS
jgi:hypothetical protein